MFLDDVGDNLINSYPRSGLLEREPTATVKAQMVGYAMGIQRYQ